MKLKQFDDFELNEYANPTPRLDTKGGMGFVLMKSTDDGIGYNIHIEFQGSAMEADMPNDWKKKLEMFANEVEKKLNGDIDWLH